MTAMLLDDVDVQQDGRDHIRISPRAKTLLGRLLANTALTPFQLPSLGHFASMEALWAYLKSGHVLDEVRSLHGDRALRETHATTRIDLRNFRALILKGLEAKIESHTQLQQLLAENSLPFVRYEVEEGEPLVEEAQGWFLAHLEKITKERRGSRR